MLYRLQRIFQKMTTKGVNNKNKMTTRASEKNKTTNEVNRSHAGSGAVGGERLRKAVRSRANSRRLRNAVS